MSLLINSLKEDNISNYVPLNLIPKLKVESESQFKTSVLENLEPTLYAEENTSNNGKDPLADGELPIFTKIRPDINCPKIAYQTCSTASVSNELSRPNLKPVVVLKRLCLPEIGSIQTKRDSTITRSGEDDQHLQGISRNTVRQTAGTSFRGSTPLLTHIGLKSFTCAECGKSFRRKYILKKHLIRHSGLKLFTCVECPKSFVIKGDLTKHIISHKGLKLYKCNECDKSFGLKVHLKRHLISHTGLKLFTCAECGKSFGERHHLKRHLNAHASFKLYTCEVCGKSFGDNHYLKRHLNAHAGFKLYTCEVCDKSFGHRSNFVRHLKFHTS